MHMLIPNGSPDESKFDLGLELGLDIDALSAETQIQDDPRTIADQVAALFDDLDS